MSYQTRRLTIIVLILLTLTLATVSVYVAINLNQADISDTSVYDISPACDIINPDAGYGAGSGVGSYIEIPTDDPHCFTEEVGSNGETIKKAINFKVQKHVGPAVDSNGDGQITDSDCLVSVSNPITFNIQATAGLNRADWNDPSICGCIQIDIIKGDQDDPAANGVLAGNYGAAGYSNNNCEPEVTTYRCDTTTSTCNLDAGGNFEDIASCEDACGASTQRYSCDLQTYTCREDSNGQYGNLASCSENCEAPPRYYCDQSTYTCKISTDGNYTDLTTCTDNCQPPETKYYCDQSTFTCKPGTNGNYSNIGSCQDNCIPQFCGQPCGGKDGLTCPNNHVCDPSTKKCVLNACLNDPTCTDNGCKLPESAIFGDSRDYLIYAALLMILGIIMYKWNILKFAYNSKELVNELNHSLIESAENSKAEKEHRKIEKEREKFESRFKKR